MSIPEGIKFTKNHEWVMADGDVLTVGISDYAQGELGEIVFVELPEVGDSFDAGEETAAIESVKAASDVYSPAAGEIIEVNENLEDAPESINSDAYSGWIFKIRVDGDITELLTPDEYAVLIEE